MSDIRQMPVAIQRLVDFISLATHKRNNTGAVTTVERNCDICCVRLNIVHSIETHIKRKRLKLGGGQAYDRSSV
jgi:hypothetical protein